MIPGSSAVVELQVAVRREDAIRFLGYPEAVVPPDRVGTRLDRALREARRLVKARGIYRWLPVARARDVGLDPIDAAGLVIGLVTAGSAIERRVSELTLGGDATGALLLDAAGSAAAEEAADRLGAHLVADAASLPAGAISCRISPGYGSWPLEAQKALFDRLSHEALGVELLPSLMMVPRKSVSFAMWLGGDARPLAGCSRCALGHCKYRRVTASSSAQEHP